MPRSRFKRFLLIPVLALSSVTLLGVADPFALGRSTAAIAQTFKNWGLINTQAKSHIDAVDAWKIESGSRDVIVAVIDTGIDPKHKDLEKNIWHDPDIKDVYGWNYV